MYSEFRNEDEAIKKAVEAEIEAVIKGIRIRRMLPLQQQVTEKKLLPKFEAYGCL